MGIKSLKQTSERTVPSVIDIKYEEIRNEMNELKSVIAGRHCAILLPGKSIKRLETDIKKYADKDICWTSMGVFNVLEKGILSKIDKQLSIVLDCATVPTARFPHYEKYARKPRLEPYLARKKRNLLLTTNGMIRDAIKPHYPENFLDKYGHKIVIIDDIFPGEDRAKWMDVPNSATLLIAALFAGEARSIVIFGMDGYKGDISIGYESYYKPGHVVKERFHAMGTVEDPGINRDTGYFEERFPHLLLDYRNLFDTAIPIFNCSPNSIYSCPQKITYEDLEVFYGATKH